MARCRAAVNASKPAWRLGTRTREWPLPEFQLLEGLQEGLRLEPGHCDELNFEIRDSVAIDVALHEKVTANHAEPDGIGHRGITPARTAQVGIDLDRIGFPVARMVAQANWGEFRGQP